MPAFLRVLLVAAIWVCGPQASADKPAARLLAVGVKGGNTCIHLGPVIPSVSYGNLILGDCDDTAANRWVMHEPEAGATGTGYWITNEAKGYCVSTFAEKGRRVQTWACVNGANQYFPLVNREGDTFFIKDEAHGFCFQVEDDSGEEGTQIVTGSCKKGQPLAQFKRIPIGVDLDQTSAPAPTPVKAPPPAGDCAYRSVPSGQHTYDNLSGMDISPGRSITTTKARFFDDCVKSCLLCDGCVAFVYNPTTELCALKDNRNTVATDDENVLAGVFNNL